MKKVEINLEELEDLRTYLIQRDIDLEESINTLDKERKIIRKILAAMKILINSDEIMRSSNNNNEL